MFWIKLNFTINGKKKYYITKIKHQNAQKYCQKSFIKSSFVFYNKVNKKTNYVLFRMDIIANQNIYLIFGRNRFNKKRIENIKTLSTTYIKTIFI